MNRRRTSPRPCPTIRTRLAAGDRTRTVTAGIDGTLAGMDAPDWAAREALRRGVPLCLLHVAADPDPHRQPRRALVADRARGVLDRAAITLSYVHPALRIHAQQPSGPAAAALLAAAADAETLVLGSRGLSGCDGFLVGSVASAVAARAERPVVLVRAGERPEDAHVPDADGGPSRSTPYRPVVLALDLPLPGGELTGYAFDAAAVRGAPLHVVHVWTVPPLVAYAPGRAVPDVLAERAEHARRKLTAALLPWRRAHPATKVVEHVRFGRTGHHLLKAATGASLLVVGRHAQAGPGLGRTAHSVVHHVACPIAVVPHG
ncbi:universal stress protein [Streptomyces flavofungini]|uniref:Universal stress protein n=1 Tax=Streptomyces flavofungini TaxID=68200 RepID=A0ABS0XFA5_9ACTN|nr:universal stress protein [Streptomyces flavofungini]MBJ3811887.1 universal stress protein [Streptomyces flavofungini]GHC52686.1 stress-inducible protein [Streptomyces flavofungini]